MYFSYSCCLDVTLTLKLTQSSRSNKFDILNKATHCINQSVNPSIVYNYCLKPREPSRLKIRYIFFPISLKWVFFQSKGHFDLQQQKFGILSSHFFKMGIFHTTTVFEDILTFKLARLNDSDIFIFHR